MAGALKRPRTRSTDGRVPHEVRRPPSSSRSLRQSLISDTVLFSALPELPVFDVSAPLC